MSVESNSSDADMSGWLRGELTVFLGKDWSKHTAFFEKLRLFCKENNATFVSNHGTKS